MFLSCRKSISKIPPYAIIFSIVDESVPIFHTWSSIFTSTEGLSMYIHLSIGSIELCELSQLNIVLLN